MTETEPATDREVSFVGVGLVLGLAVAFLIFAGLWASGTLDGDVKGCAEAIIVHEVALSQAELDELGGPNRAEIDDALRCVEEYREKWQ